jgi:hypothetical protein
MEITLRLPMPTSINKLYINEYNFEWNPKTRKRESKPTGRRILSPEGRKVKAQIQGEARVQLEQQKGKWDYDWTKENFCYQDALVVFARRGSDDNNIYKLLNDSLEGIVYDNDSRVLVRTQKIVYNPKDPHVIVTLRPVEFVGIFDSVNEASQFESICKSGGNNGKGCSKYRNGKCSILQDSLIGTVREEIGSVSSPYCTSFTDRK